MKIRNDNFKKISQGVFKLTFICLLLSASLSWAQPIRQEVNILKEEVSSIKEDINKIKDDLNKLLHPNGNPGTGQGDVQVIISDTPPLAIPQAFKDAVEQLGGDFIIIGNRHKKVRMLSLNGVYYNPCSKVNHALDSSIYNEAAHTCKISVEFSDVLQLLTQEFVDDGGAGDGCGLCTPASGGALKGCKKSTDRHSCSAQTLSCDDNGC